jgi:aminotransferase EvaB
MLKDINLILPVEAEYDQHAYYLYVVRHPLRDRIIEELKKQEIYLNISYPWPIHIMSGYSNIGYKEGMLPITEKFANEIFFLLMYPSLTDKQQQIVVNAIKLILK